MGGARVRAGRDWRGSLSRTLSGVRRMQRKPRVPVRFLSERRRQLPGPQSRLRDKQEAPSVRSGPPGESLGFPRALWRDFHPHLVLGAALAPSAPVKFIEGTPATLKVSVSSEAETLPQNLPAPPWSAAEIFSHGGTVTPWDRLLGVASPLQRM